MISMSRNAAIRGCFLALAAMWQPMQVMAQPDMRVQSIRFVPGKTNGVAHGVIRGDDTQDYRLTLAANEKFSVSMRTSHRSSYFNITAPGADTALHIGSTGGNQFSGSAPQAGDYTIRVYLMRNAARRNESARYSLNVTRETPAPAMPKGDFADGLMGGPDFWVVSGLRGRSSTALRHAPRSSAAGLARLREGTVVKNLGCRMTGQTRWCQVDFGEERGWVNGRFLRESAAPGAARRDDALVPGTNFHATGEVPCKIMAAPAASQCAFGVTRGERGVATVFITLPSGAKRVLGFSGGEARSLQAASSVTQRRDSDNTIVTIDGGAEQYTIPDALVNGG